MTAPALLDLLSALRNGVDPQTGECFAKADSCLGEPKVRRHLNDLIKAITFTAADAPVAITDDFIRSACAEIRALGYEPSVPQLAKVFIGSRSIANKALKGLNCYNRFRGAYPRDVIHSHLLDFARRQPEVLAETPAVRKRKERDPWLDVDFFRVESFDKLDEEKAAELTLTVADLGLRKPTDRLPEYMARARQNYPRAYEPWTRDEQALLIEAMCYTNDLARLTTIFGRAARSLERTGQRLIFDSQQKQRA